MVKENRQVNVTRVERDRDLFACRETRRDLTMLVSMLCTESVFHSDLRARPLGMSPAGCGASAGDITCGWVS